MHNNHVEATDIAIVGLSFRFPGAANLDELWQVICGTEDVISRGSRAEDESWISARGQVKQSDHFDYQYFGYSPSEASLLDPQHRLFLEAAAAALLDGGIVSSQNSMRTGVFAATSSSSYFQHVLSANSAVVSRFGDYQLYVTNDKDFLASRVAYKLGLTGPALNVQTACSSGLVTVHVAIQSLLTFECDSALAGSVTISAPTQNGYFYHPESILSQQGKCCPFDAHADGIVPSEGVGVVLLKRLADALENGDHIHAVIKGSAINNDGAQKAGFTAPSVNGQKEVLEEALEVAGLTPKDIAYIEAHGTGTATGDPIEFEALRQVYAECPLQSIGLGSVKSVIGHLDTAAGIAGLIKSIAILKYRALPPQINYSTPNPLLKLSQSPFYINKRTKSLDAERIRIGVSSFGIGGTNSHLILEGYYPPAKGQRSDKDCQLPLFLSARSSNQLQRDILALKEHLRCNPNLSYTDLAYTLSKGREMSSFRKAFRAEDIINGIGFQPIDRAVDSPPKIVFMIPGQGVQFAGMARRFASSCPFFLTQIKLLVALYARISKSEVREDQLSDFLLEGCDKKGVDCTRLIQPSLVISQIALARTLERIGIVPDLIIGSSLGEYVAASLSGVIDTETLFSIVHKRSVLMAKQVGGGMIAIMSDRDKIENCISHSLSLAISISPELSIYSGDQEAIRQAERKLEQEDIGYKILQVEHAFHSKAMDAVLEPFSQFLEQCSFDSVKIPYASNLTGNFFEPGDTVAPDYWIKQLRSTVQLESPLQHLAKLNDRTLVVEIGPGDGLTKTLARMSKSNSNIYACTLGKLLEESSEASHFQQLLTSAFESGFNLQLPVEFFREAPRMVSIPTPTYNSVRCWIDESPHELKAKVMRLSPHVIGVPLGIHYPAILKEPFFIWGEDSFVASMMRQKLEGTGRKARVVGTCEGLQCIEQDCGTAHLIVIPPRDLGHESVNRYVTELCLTLRNLKDRIADSKIHVAIIAEGSDSGMQLTFGNPYHSVLSPILNSFCGENSGVYGDIVVYSESDWRTASEDIINQIAIILLDDRRPEKSLFQEYYVKSHSVYAPCVEEYQEELLPQMVSPMSACCFINSETGLGNYFANELRKLGEVRVIELRNREESQVPDEVGESDEVIFVDLSNVQQISHIFEKLKSKYGLGLSLVFAPRETGGERLVLISDVQFEDVERQFNYKVNWLVNCAIAAKRSGISRVTTLSSLSSIVQNIGYGVYAAANRFIDSFSRSQGGWRCLNFDVVDLDDKIFAPHLKEVHSRRLTKEAAFQFFRAAQSSRREPQLILSLADFAAAKEERVSPAMSSIQHVEASSPTDLLLQLRQFWTELLGVEQISDSSDFFKLGGHSLLATRLVGMVKRKAGLKVTLSQLYENPTPAQLCQALKGQSSAHRAVAANVNLRLSINSEAARVETGSSSGISESNCSPLELSLSFFSGEVGTGDIYRTLREVAQYADSAGFKGLWIPERHFNSFGGLYPSPAVICSYLAGITKSIELYAGSCVLSFDNPIRLAEQWACVDNLSGGRVGISFASGWSYHDFMAFERDGFSRKEQLLKDKYHDFKTLWEGGEVIRDGLRGEQISLKVFPRPINRKPPLWFTAAGNPETFKLAGRLGVGVLTHLLDKDIDTLALRVAEYRAERKIAGHVGDGTVTVLLHTFLGDDLDEVRETCRAPFKDYLTRFLSLKKAVAFSQPEAEDPDSLSEAEREVLLEHAYQRYFNGSSLLGTKATVREMMRKLSNAGVTEVGCLIDFGVPFEKIMGSLGVLSELLPVKGGGLKYVA